MSACARVRRRSSLPHATRDATCRHPGRGPREGDSHDTDTGHRSGHHVHTGHRVRWRDDAGCIRAGGIRPDLPRIPAGSSTTRRSSGPRRSPPCARRANARPARSPPSASPTSAKPWSCGIARPARPSTTPSSGRTGARPMTAALREDGHEPMVQQKTGPAARPLFLGLQARVAAGQRRRRAGAGGGGQARLRHHRQLADLEADGRQAPCHRRHQRGAHAALQHPQRGGGTTIS
jgi:hypothetical protein